MPGIIGFGATLDVNDGASNAYEDIPEVTMITLPDLSTTSVETTYLGLSEPYKTFTPGLTDAGVLTFDCNWSSATYARMFALLGKLKHSTRIPPTGTDVNWRITSPDEDASGSGGAQTYTFNGFLTKIGQPIEIEGVMKMSCEVKISGEITIA